MKKIMLLLFCFFAVSSTKLFPQNKDSISILAVLNMQKSAWNAGDIEKYMSGYWQHDSLVFISKKKTTYGWKNVLNNYQKGYPDKSAMGVLDFSQIQLTKVAGNQYFVMGNWHLHRSKDSVGGSFHLLFQKINQRWVIVMDYTN